MYANKKGEIEFRIAGGKFHLLKYNEHDNKGNSTLSCSLPSFSNHKNQGKTKVRLKLMQVCSYHTRFHLSKGTFPKLIYSPKIAIPPCQHSLLI